MAQGVALRAAGLAVFFGVGEAVVRALFPPLVTEGKYSRWTDEPYGYEMVPGAKVIVSSTEVTINSMGFRDGEVTLAKPPNTLRVLVLGNSHVFGEGVREDQVFTGLLEKKLETAADGGGTVEVLNLGVFGYRTAQEVHLLERRGLEFDPDVVVILYNLSDVSPPLVSVPGFDSVALSHSVPPRPRSAGDPRGELERSLAENGERKGLMGGFRELIRRSELARAVYFRLKKLFVGIAVGDVNDQHRPDSPGWIGVRSSLSHAKRLCDDNGARLLLVIHPKLIELDSYPYHFAHGAVKKFCSATGIEVADLLDAYRGQDGRSLWIHRENAHPNAKGHQIIAEFLAGYFRSNPVELHRARADTVEMSEIHGVTGN